MSQNDLEIVCDDEDIRTQVVSYGTDDFAYVTQTDTGGHSTSLIFTRSMAAQTIAALQAFLAGDEPHASDCALHSSPAEPISACDCREAVARAQRDVA